MNKFFLAASIILALAFQSVCALAQAPQKVNYQMVVRDASGELVNESAVGVQISILQGASDGSAVYVETHAPTTNVNGLVSFEVGSGTPVLNTFADIDWAGGPYFLKTETDPAGGSSYTITGISEILSVPYALHSKTAETASGTLLARIEALEAREEANLIANGFTDPRDSNHYDVVKIGNQIWMAENLAYLPNVNQVADGSEDAPGSYYYVYDYDGINVAEAKATANYTTYGVLYNWTAAIDGEASSATNPSGVQGVCPAGWHLSSDAEWTELTEYLGGLADAGGKLKENGTTHWLTPNTGASNETGFTALPGGSRRNDSLFGAIGGYGFWWSATEGDATSAWVRYMYYESGSVSRNFGLIERGFSVRCVRD
jgi:uncharacterized protein (TIGR02145 family)